jgi:membrane fusion protein, macrolide-specific efflux system
LTLGCVGERPGQSARHCPTLAALMRGIMGSKSTQLLTIAPDVPDGNQLAPADFSIGVQRGRDAMPRHPMAVRSTEKWMYAMRHIIRKQSTIMLIAIVVLLCAGLLAQHFFFAKNAIIYSTATAMRMDIEETVLASGTLKAFKMIDIGAQVSGQLKKLHVALGDRVKKGQLLAEIDPVLQQNSLRNAMVELENVQAQKRSKQALLQQYESAYQRQRQMIAQDAATRADLENAQAQLDSTRADIAALEAQLKKAMIAVDTAKANLDYTRIVAPMDGVIIAIVTEEGQTVVAAQTAPIILKLANLDTITVKAQISEADVIRVKPGQTVYFTILGDPDTRYYSTLRAIEPAPDSLSTTSTSSSSSSTSTAVYYNGLFDVPNPGNKLRVSMTAQVSIVVNEAKRALGIPVSALRAKGPDGRYAVQVLRDNLPEERTIRIGINNNISVQVLDGLEEGDKVIIGNAPPLLAPN